MGHRLRRSEVLAAMLLAFAAAARADDLAAGKEAGYFPLPESKGGWRTIEDREAIRKAAGMDPAKLDELKEWLL
ncbi:MAG TPA: hypothetical protein VFV87_00220, partial [Pirellulaceae bacterium]|nr:hypothetical protein [Pirellulaceae bacterium]